MHGKAQDADRIQRALAGSVSDESGHRVVPLALVREIAASEGLNIREFEAELLLGGIVPLRYLRSIGVIGMDGQAKLLLSSAAVVGCGGLGGWIVELMARAGIGRLTLIDGDTFSESNLNRQMLCTEAALGRGKAEAAAARVREINGAVETAVCPEMLTADNAEALLEKHSIVFDALDNLPSRLLVLNVTRRLGIPMIHGAVAGWWGQVCASGAGNDVLASLWEGREKGAETTAGTPCFTPSAVASLQAAMGIQMLLDGDKHVSADLLWVDMKDPGLERLPLKR